MSLIRILMKVKVMMILNNLQREVVRRLKMALNLGGTRFTSFLLFIVIPMNTIWMIMIFMDMIFMMMILMNCNLHVVYTLYNFTHNKK